MHRERSLYPRMILTLLALLGFLDSLYLSLSRIRPDNPMACPVGGGCEVVQASAWSTLPPGQGVPVAFLGVAGYLVFFGLGLLALQRDTIGTFQLPRLILLIASLGILFSIYLVTIQLVLIKAVCFWCMMSAFFELGIWLAALFDWRAWTRTTSKQLSRTASLKAR